MGPRHGFCFLVIVTRMRNERGKWLYALSSPGTVEAFSVDPTSGVLTKINALQGVDASVTDFALTVQYVTNRSRHEYVSGFGALVR